MSAFLSAIATTVTLDMNTIILAIIGLVPALFSGYIVLRQTAMAAEQKEQKVAQVAATESMKEIHVAVNSAKTVLENKVDGLIKQNVELAKKVAELEENKRGTELAKAVASMPIVAVPAVPIQVALAPAPTSVAAPAPAPAHVTVEVPAVVATPVTRISEAIDELTAAAEETSNVAKEASKVANEASVAADVTVDLAKQRQK